METIITDRAKPFHLPVKVRLDIASTDVWSAEQAARMLADVAWPARGKRHETALDACLKALDGHRSTVDARNAFVEAAREADVLLEF
ncbi:MAG: DUF982 domain-containing protein [Rhizobiaceae bacterium]|nr:DUF982 domain-containing protein [Rhizobiaceae bacterium]MCV0408649.1 DUF982 domain-containing protein [Rhizobiaceae bacterium]